MPRYYHCRFTRSITNKDLQNLSLKTQGGKVGSLIIAEGEASQILKALQLPAIKCIKLDTEIPLKLRPIPVPLEMVNYLTDLILEIVP